MEGEHSGLYRPNVPARNQDFYKDNEKLVGVSVAATEDSVPQVIGLGQKRKRGRLTKGRKKEEEQEEDVCFICFDGGCLVLCDRKGCPKAYHPACIRRDESFFRSKAKWNCGWHICSVCQKASHYMCYTCTYSLCKGCTKDADYVCVRGNKGFCTICMKTIMLIENKDQMNSESVQVDFDDSSSWEYLFKVYWIYLKEKLSLTLSELTQAKNPCKEVGTVACKHLVTDVHHNTRDGKVSISYRSSEHLESSNPKEQLNLQKKDSLSTESLGISKEVDPSHNKGNNKSSTDEGMDKPCVDEGAEWASKDLLEFVAHMRNGDTSVLSQFDVQSLLLDYVKRNNLEDARWKSQINCDLRLKNMFGKPCVGHIEMLKLLEFHFLIKEDSRGNAFIPAGIVVPVANGIKIDENSYNSFMMSTNRKRKTCKKGEERVPHKILDEYAAIDVHNINLIYLRRNLMKDLVEDKEKCHDKVVGSIVRIKISSDPKQDIYRLVQVVGIRKTDEPYKIGDRTSDFMLEVLNLYKQENILIDAISNQEFSKDECRQLRQSMRCGLVKRLTVGMIQKKAMELQAARLNDRLEAEILMLNHLRDQASEKGHEKKEYVDKLDLLKMPEERQRRICEVLEIHTDPKMDPNYESEEDDGGGNNHRQDEYVRPSYMKFSQSGRKSPKKEGVEVALTEVQYRTCEKIDVMGSNCLEKHIGRVNITNSPIGGWSDEAKLRSGSKTSTATVSLRNSPSANNSETEKLWHYCDPSGKIQGPFSMVQLRTWSTTGLFPSDMRIWTNNEHYDSLLLTDALNGQFHGMSKFPYYASSKALELGAVPDNRLPEGYGGKYSIARTQYQMTSGCDHEDQSNNQSQASQSSGENLRVLAAANGKGSRSNLTPLHRPDSPNVDGDICLSDLLSPTPKASSQDCEVQNVENQQSASADVPVQNSDILDLPSPTPKPSDEYQATDTKRSLLVMNGAQLPEIANKWSGYSPTPAKPSIEEWDNDLVAASSLKPLEAISVHTAIWTSNSDQHTHSSQSHLTSDFHSWQGIVDEPIELDALSVESVSDLLAEVDAMESRSGLASPTSGTKFCKELTQDFGKEVTEDNKDYCFGSIGDFCQTPDPGKGSSISSTRDRQLTCQPKVACEPVGGLVASQVHTPGPFRSSSGHSSWETKATDTPV